MNVTVDLEDCCGETGLPDAARLRLWAEAATEAARQSGRVSLEASERLELSVRVIDETESARLNRKYRRKNHPTNVLSFSGALPDHVLQALPCRPLGDLAICARVVARQATEQGKPLMAHWAHMTVHGVLHLLGFDHEDADEAGIMEGLEVNIMQQLGYPDPYRLPAQA